MSVAENERRKDLADIEKLMEKAEGRRIVWRLLETCKVFVTTFSHEPLTMAFNEGGRNVGLQFLADVKEVAPKRYMVMELEAQERKRIVMATLEKEQEMANEEA